MATETFLGRAFEKHGVYDWEELFGGKGDAHGKMCELCPDLEACKIKGERCNGKRIIGLMASTAVVKGGLFPAMLADILRDTVTVITRETLFIPKVISEKEETVPL